MSDTKIYLNVPYAQKDEAKALGARWDATRKKWYVSAGKDIGLFAQWHADQEEWDEVKMTTSGRSVDKAKKPGQSSSQGSGVITYSTIPNFVAYDGDLPPWD